MRTLVRFLASSLLVGSTVTALVGCSGGSSGGRGADAEDNPFAPPAGCTRTQCDVDRDSCDSDQASQCSECVAGAASAVDAGRAGSDGGGGAPDARSTVTVDTGAGQPADGGAATTPDAAAWLYCGNPDLGAFPAIAPSAAPQAACTDDEIASIASAIDLDASTLVEIVQGTSASCQQCALSQAQDAAWGPLVQISGEEVMLNQGNCVAQSDTTCAAEVNQLFFCVQEACSTCTDDDSDETCTAAAQTDVCAAYALDDACTTEATSGASSSCFPGSGNPDTDLASYVLTLQCGSM